MIFCTCPCDPWGFWCWLAGWGLLFLSCRYQLCVVLIFAATLSMYLQSHMQRLPYRCVKGVSCYSDGLDLISPFRSLARPSLPSALLSLTLAPSGLSLSYFLRPHPITAPLDPTHPLPHPRFLAGRFVFIGTCHCSFVYFLFFYVCFCVLNTYLLNNTFWQCSILVSFCLTSSITSFCFLTRTFSVGCLILVSNLWLWDLLNRAGHGRYLLVYPTQTVTQTLRLGFF